MITTGSDNLEKVRKTPRPTTKKLVRSFLVLVGYYRDHTPAFAKISAPLSSSRKESQNKYNGMKHRSMHIHCSRSICYRNHFPDLMKLPDLTKPFILTTDASGVGVAAVTGVRRKVLPSRLRQQEVKPSRN